jgi:hypothetical protein
MTMTRASWRFVLVTCVVVLAGLALSAIVGAASDPPDITAVSPNPVQPANDAQPISVSGHNFQERLVLSVTGPDGNALEYREPAIRDRQVRSFVVPVVFAATGRYTLVVTNADGGVSNAFIVQAKAQTAAPVIEAIKPERLQASMNPQALQVQGQRFAPGLTVLVTDPTGTVQTIGGGQVSDVRPTSMQVMATLELPGDYTMVLTSASGVTSNAFAFHVNRAAAQR